MNSIFSMLTSRFKLISLIVIATSLAACQSETSAETLDDSKYTVIGNPIAVSTGDKIEVVELFWYGCGHCFALEPHVNNWKAKMPENAEFVKVPATFNRHWEFHAKAYYTMETLNVLDKANDAFFHQLHVKRQNINSLPALSKFLEAYGKTEDEVSKAFNSFEVDTKFRNAQKITRMSTARGVPAILVDGKYHTSGTLAGSGPEMFKVVNQLIDKAAGEREPTKQNSGE